MKRSTFRILFYIKRGNPKKNGNVVIMGRITIDGERAQFSTKLEIHPDKWDNKMGRAKGNSTSIVNLNRLLDNIRAKASMHYTRMMD
ncbi:site-specific integrase, partial [Bacteroides sp. OttesenSCG-928-F21]|nr:site-specific integrase [Bacteroides sp. OttesenSCG-928-F21]